MPSKQEDLLKGRYRVEGILAEGGMGAVYRAFDTLTDRPCALKQFRLAYLPSEEETRLHPDRDDEATRVHDSRSPSPVTREKAVKQFHNEARLLAELEHPNLPKVFDFFAEGSDWYLVMDLIEGQNLATVLRDAGNQPLPEKDVLRWTDQVMDALSYCHGQDVIHRDIKPANIVLTESGKVYLVDFGIAKPSAGATTVLAAFTSGYSSPEHYDEKAHTDERSDIYALGATMYHLLTGHEPDGAIQRMRGERLPSPRSRVGSISTTVDAAIMRAMAIAPEKRFRSVVAMRDALSAVPRSPRRMWGWTMIPATLLIGLVILWMMSSRPFVRDATSTPGRTRSPGATGTVYRTRTPVATFTPTIVPSPTQTSPALAAATASPTPRPTPTPMPAAKFYAEVISESRLRVRSGPSEEDEIIDHVYEGDCLGVSSWSSGTHWYMVNTPRNVEGWIYSAWVRGHTSSRCDGRVTPPPNVQATFRVSPDLIQPRQCTRIEWNVGGAKQVLLDFSDRGAEGDFEHCSLEETHTFLLILTLQDGSQWIYPKTVVVDEDAPDTSSGMDTHFRADQRQINAGQCTHLRWDVDNVQAVYLDGAGRPGHSVEQVCPSQTRTYTLKAVGRDGAESKSSLTIEVIGVLPLALEYKTSVWCPGPRNYAIDFVLEAKGGKGPYTYHLDDKQIGGPTGGGVNYRLLWQTCGAAVGTLRVRSADGQEDSEKFWIGKPSCCR